MKNKPQDIGKLHDQYDSYQGGEQSNAVSRFKCPYEFLVSVDVGWIPCDISETDTKNELVKVIYPHPNGEGWMDITGAGGVYEEVVQMWRVRVRED